MKDIDPVFGREVSKMMLGSGLARSRAQRQGRIGLAFIMALVLLLAMAPYAAGAVGYQPYETGPVIHTNWLAPYAGYAGGYQPYETGPVIHTNWLAP